MKSSEQCFLEILSNIKINKDSNQQYIKTDDTWCKLRNFDNSYIFTGYIELEKNAILYFFFSNSKSCLSIKSDKYKLNETKLVDDLFNKYHIDEFINNYIKNLY